MSGVSEAKNLPEGFVYLKEVIPNVQQVSRYFGKENFIGKRVTGYESPDIIITLKTAESLKKVNDELKERGFELVIYDAYRPQKAVDEFVKWGKTNESSKKELYYPFISKSDIFKRGFVATKSGHSRGSTVDLTIIETGKKALLIPRQVHRVLSNGNKVIFLDDGTLDMGLHFDYFGTESWHNSPLISKEYNKKRKGLRHVMEKHGFKAMEGEWWHYTLENEPFPNTYFDF